MAPRRTATSRGGGMVMMMVSGGSVAEEEDDGGLPQPVLDAPGAALQTELEAAIAEGATIVRIGTDIFGPRD